MQRWLRRAVAVTVGSVVAYRLLSSPWHQNWGATEDEITRPLPGDDLIAEPATQATRAITIEAPPEAVWPWVVQLGADRGGFYSYDWLENLFGLDIHSADAIVPEWQQREVGELVHANRSGTGGWYVMDVRPNEALVLKMADVAGSRPAPRDEQLKWEFLWTFAVARRTDGATRLLVRERAGSDSAATRLLMAPVGLVSFVMTRRMLRGIRTRAEGAGPTGDDVDEGHPTTEDSRCSARSKS